MRTIDVIDFKGGEWQLLAPPIRWCRNRHELWLLVVKRPLVSDDLRTYLEIPVPVFTDWWYEMTDARYKELSDNHKSILTYVEFTAGWHFCWDWDGLLVNAYDTEGEGSACTCYRRVT